LSTRSKKTPSSLSVAATTIDNTGSVPIFSKVSHETCGHRFEDLLYSSMISCTLYRWEGQTVTLQECDLGGDDLRVGPVEAVGHRFR
jgi:hypothetical protein